jgi:hypothetical protein
MSNLPPLPEPLAFVAQFHGEWRETVSASSEPVFKADQLKAFAEEAVKQEREQCALECERVYGPDERGAKACAVLIRARSQEGQ